MNGTVFPGSQAEQQDLLVAVEHNCSCVRTMFGTNSTCAAHAAVATDQRWLNGLVFVRGLRDRLEAEEWSE